jgi:hypothetical protein
VCLKRPATGNLQLTRTAVTDSQDRILPATFKRCPDILKSRAFPCPIIPIRCRETLGHILVDRMYLSDNQAVTRRAHRILDFSRSLQRQCRGGFQSNGQRSTRYPYSTLRYKSGDLGELIICCITMTVIEWRITGKWYTCLHWSQFSSFNSLSRQATPCSWCKIFLL